MSTLIKILVIACGLSVAKGAEEMVTNNTTITVGTNVACMIKIDPVNGWDVGPAPVCFVRLTNSSDSMVITLRMERLWKKLNTANNLAGH